MIPEMTPEATVNLEVWLGVGYAALLAAGSLGLRALGARAEATRREVGAARAPAAAEAARVHLALAAVVCAVALGILGAVSVRHHDPADLAALAPAVAIVVYALPKRPGARLREAQPRRAHRGTGHGALGRS